MAKILIIDDDKLVLDTLKGIVGITNHSCIVLNDPEKVISTIIEEKVDLLITDIIMPYVSGFDLLEHINELGINIKIIVMSGGGAVETDSYLNTAKYLGAHRTIRKPISVSKMLVLIKELL